MSDAPLAETHRRVWGALDALADMRALSASGLAKIAGLDATAFNPSKRVGRDGRLRWPSVETLAKVMSVTGEDFHGLARLIDGRPKIDSPKRLPVLTLGETGAARPSGAEAPAPDLADPDAFWLEIEAGSVGGAGGAYRAGDRLLIAPNSPQEIGCRVAVALASGAVRVGRLAARDDFGLAVAPLLERDAAEGEARCRYDQLAWIGRILWASQ